MAKKIELVKGEAFDIAYQIEMNEWNGEKKLELMVKDIRATAP